MICYWIHVRVNLGKNKLRHVCPYDFLIGTITCAWLLLGLLMVYSVRLSTRVQIFLFLG